MERKSKTIASAAALVLCIAVFQSAVRPLPIASTRRLPISRVPPQIADWESSGDEPVAEEVKAKLPTAEIVQRTYRNAEDVPVEMVLVTAMSNADIHNPLDCFPAQGWTLGSYRTDTIAGQRINTMVATQGQSQMAVYYYYTGYYDPPLSDPALRSVRSLRSKLLGTLVGMSLFVRISGPNTPEGLAAVRSFSSHLVPLVRTLAGPGNRPPDDTIDRPISGFHPGASQP